MMSDRKLLKLSDIAEFNPRESLAKETVAKKIAMDKLQPFTRDVTPMFKQVWENQEENEKLAGLRDALLPRLMSGEIDVSEVEL